MIKGDIDIKSGEYRQDLDIVSTGNLKEQLNDTIKMLPSNIVQENDLKDTFIENSNSIKITDEYSNIKDYTFSVINGKVYYRINDYLYEHNKNKSSLERIKAIIEVRDALKELIKIENTNIEDTDVIPYQEKLNKVYDKFVKKYGNINSRSNSLIFKIDADYPLMCALEKEDKKTKEITKTDIFTKRTIRPYKK